VMDRGTSSVGGLLSYLAFNILPVFVEYVSLAVLYISIQVEWSESQALVLLTDGLSIYFFPVRITEWRTGLRREMNDAEAASRGRAVDSLLSFETVGCCFGNEEMGSGADMTRLSGYIRSLTGKSSSSLNVLTRARNCVITLELYLEDWPSQCIRIQEGKITDWGVAVFATSPLSFAALPNPSIFFGTYYRVIQQNFIDMEK